MGCTNRKPARLVLAAGILILNLMPSGIVACEGPGSTGAGYLTFSIGPKSTAMGEVKAAIPDDPFNWLANPGSFHYMKGSGAGVLHSEWIVDTNLDNLSVHHRFSGMIIVSGALTYGYRPDIQGYDELGMETKMLKSNNYQALLGIGISPVKSFTAGVNVKYFREKLDEWSAGGVTFDLGALYAFDQSRIALGFAVQNLGGDIRFETLDEPLPITARIGVSHVITVRGEAAEFTYALDMVKARYESNYLSLGCELDLYKTLAIRAGYCGQEYRNGDGLTLGGGINIKDRIKVDYAWTPYGDLGNFHRISIYFAMN